MVFCNLAKPRENKKNQKKQKVQTHGQGLGRGLAGDMGLNFLFFLGFSIVFCSLAKTSRKPKKKVQTHGQGLGRGLAGDMGLIFFHGFLHVFHVKMLSSQYLSKNARFYNLHTCAPHEYPF